MESRVIKLTAGAIKNNKLNIRACGPDFFPFDVLGGSNKSQPGKQIIIKADGLLEPIKTDIPVDKKTGKPRWIFRKRSWVREFVQYHKLRPDDTVRINRINERTYEVVPENNHRRSATEFRLSTTYEIYEGTREERRIGIYQKNTIPTKASEVTNETPLEMLNLNWREKDLPERERTQHVHRLQFYCGKSRYERGVQYLI